MLRAYDAGELEREAALFVACAGAHGCPSEEPEALASGWRALLRERSAYFGAMFCGAWAESSGGAAAVHVRWDREQLRRLLRFLHGAPFVGGPGDLPAAVECAEFFGVPDLLVSAADWIAANLEPATAPSLWTFLDGFRHSAQAPDALADADEACFQYHVAHFEEICDSPTEEGESPAKAAIHALSAGLFQRLLASGLVDAPTASLLGTVKMFAKLKAASGEATDARALCQSLRPPAVLFNREVRSRLMPTATGLTARSFV